MQISALWLCLKQTIAPIKNVSATVPEASPPKHVAQTVRETGTLPHNKHVQH